MKDEATGTLWVEKGRLRFRYDTHWLEQSGVMALSQSLPLQIEVFDDQVCRPFFAGLLPEGDLRRCGEPGSRGSRARASRGGMANSNAADHAAQDKLLVVVEVQRIGLPKGNAASTHILKPAIAAVDNSVTNEAFCMALARMVKLRAADTQILMAAGAACIRRTSARLWRCRPISNIKMREGLICRPASHCCAEQPGPALRK